MLQVILGGHSAHFKTMMQKARNNPMSVSPKAKKMEKHLLNTLSVMTGNFDFFFIFTFSTLSTGKTQSRKLDFSDDSDCNDATCSFLDTMIDCPDLMMGDDDDDSMSMTMSSEMMTCMYTCMGIGGGCSDMTLSSSCASMLSDMYEETVDDDYCMNMSMDDDMFMDDEMEMDDDMFMDDEMEMDDDDMEMEDDMFMDDEMEMDDDDMEMDVSMICGDECMYNMYGSMMDMYTACGAIFSFDDSMDDSTNNSTNNSTDDYTDDDMMTEAFMNQLCTMNSDGDYCMDLFEEMDDDMEMEDDMLMDDMSMDDDDICGDINDMSSSDSDAMCAQMDDWGCCTSVFLSLGMPTCVSTFMTGTCDMPTSMLTTPCTSGTQEDMSVVSASMSVDVAIDLDNETESASMKTMIAAACSTNTTNVTSDQITIIGYTSFARRMMNKVMGLLRGEIGRRLASTDIDFTVTVIGDDASTDASGIMTQIESDDFTQTFTDAGMTASVSSVSSEDFEAEPPTFNNDDGAFLATFPSSLVVGIVVMLSILLF